MNFQDAASQFAKARDKTVGKKIAGHTYIVQVGESYAVRLHETNIVTFHKDGSIVLFSGGYRTRTTKERMNDALASRGVQITQEQGLWYVNSGDTKSLFTEHFTLSDGGVIPQNNDAATRIAKQKIDKLVSVYIKGFINHIVEAGIEEPDSGDCWNCLLKDAAHPERPDPMGVDHYLHHFEEKYYVPALFANAVMERHYGNPGFVVEMMRHDPDFRKREGTLILQKFFRKRKLALVEVLLRHEKVSN